MSEYKQLLNKMKVSELKQLIRAYMKDVKITLSKKKKEELINTLLEHTELIKGEIMTKKIEIDNILKGKKDKKEDKKEHITDKQLKNYEFKFPKYKQEYSKKFINTSSELPTRAKYKQFIELGKENAGDELFYKGNITINKDILNKLLIIATGENDETFTNINDLNIIIDFYEYSKKTFNEDKWFYQFYRWGFDTGFDTPELIGKGNFWNKYIAYNEYIILNKDYIINKFNL